MQNRWVNSKLKKNNRYGMLTPKKVAETSRTPLIQVLF